LAADQNQAGDDEKTGAKHDQTIEWLHKVPPPFKFAEWAILPQEGPSDIDMWM
jgi:hypothetical protein